MQSREADREILLSHAKHPLRVGELNSSEFTLIGQCKNPICGDAARVGVIEDSGLITKIRMQLSGCGISIASSSLMSEAVEGKSIREALSLFTDFNEALTQPLAAWPTSLQSLAALSHLKENPARIPCALIGWFAFKEAVLGSAKNAQPSDPPAH